MCVFMDFYAMIDMLELEENLMWIFFFFGPFTYGNWDDLKENGSLR